MEHDDVDSIMQMINDKVGQVDEGAALEDYAEEHSINRAKFMAQ